MQIIIRPSFVVGGIVSLLWVSAGCIGPAGSQSTAAKSLYFSNEDAPKQTPRSPNDGWSQLIQLGKDLVETRRNGGYTGQQISQTLSDDPEAAKSMLKTMEPYVKRAHLALEAKVAPFVVDEEQADMRDNKRPNGLPWIAMLLRANAEVKAHYHDLEGANESFEDQMRLGNLMGQNPSSRGVMLERAVRGTALTELERIAPAYHNSPKARVELSEILSRKRTRIPVLDRVRNEAFFAVQRTLAPDSGIDAGHQSSVIEGQKQAFRELADIASGCGDDFAEFETRLKNLSAKIQAGGMQRRPNDIYSVEASKDGEIRKFIGITFLSVNNDNLFKVSEDLVSIWLAAEAYRDSHGAFPPSPEAGNIPVRLDPFLHKPYGYSASGAKLKVWCDNLWGSPDRSVGRPPPEATIAVGP